MEPLLIEADLLHVDVVRWDRLVTAGDALVLQPIRRENQTHQSGERTRPANKEREPDPPIRRENQTGKSAMAVGPFILLPSLPPLTPPYLLKHHPTSSNPTLPPLTSPNPTLPPLSPPYLLSPNPNTSNSVPPPLPPNHLIHLHLPPPGEDQMFPV